MRGLLFWLTHRPTLRSRLLTLRSRLLFWLTHRPTLRSRLLTLRSRLLTQRLRQFKGFDDNLTLGLTDVHGNSSN
jgi:hypothetical protein